MGKGIAEVISFVIVILVVVVAIAVVLVFGLPILDQVRESGIVNEARQNLLILDNLIRQTAAEGTGSLKTATISVTDGSYRADSDLNSLDFTFNLKSGILPKGTYTKVGNLLTIVGGSAIASQNSTHLKIENEVLEIVFGKIGNESSFAGINTSTIIKNVRAKTSPTTTIIPSNVGIKVGNITNTSWGLGYSKLAFEGIDLPRASVLAHVRTNTSGIEYEVLYTLPASSDFMLIEVRNSTSNETTITYTYKLGTNSSNDILKLGSVNETTFSPAEGTATASVSNATLNLDNTNYTKNSSQIVANIGDASSVKYNASDGTQRDISELSEIGQGNWSFSTNSTNTTINFTLAGSDGYEFGVRDSLAGGSYWIHSNGSLYGKINISNDFITVGLAENNFTIYNSSGKIIFNSSFNDAVKIDNRNLISLYGSGTQNKTVYFFDWTNQTYKVWMRNLTGNSTHGTPDWLDPRNKQAFKWRYAFDSGNNTGLNFTFLITAHDSLVRTFVDAQAVMTVKIIPEDDTYTDCNGDADNGALGFMLLRDYPPGCGSNARMAWLKFNYTNIPQSAAVLSARVYVFPYDEFNSVVAQMYWEDFDEWNETGWGYSKQKHYDPNFHDSQGTVTFVNNQWMSWDVTAKVRSDLANASDRRSTFAILDKSGTDSGGNLASKENTTSSGQYMPYMELVYTRNITIPVSLPENRTSVTTADPGLVGYWNLNEGTGLKASDSSGNGNTGTLTSGPLWITNSSCRFGNCLSFDGSDDVVIVQDSNTLDVTSDLTIEAWVNPRAVSGTKWIVSKYDTGPGPESYAMTLAGDEVQLTVFDPSVAPMLIATSATNLAVGNWYHLVTVYKASVPTMRIYVNGVNQPGSITGSVTSIISTTTNVALGSSPNGEAADFFNGLIDGARIYKRVLNESEINQLYLTGINQQKSGIYFTKNNATDNEEVLFATTNIKNIHRVSNATPSNFNIFSNHTNFFGFNYTFNSTQNQNFMFALGTFGRMNTTLFTPQTNTSQFSGETLESIANSTMTWYDINNKPDFEDDFDTDDWSDQGGTAGNNIEVNTTTQQIVANVSGGSANYGTMYDLQNALGTGVNASDSKWVLRFKIHFALISGANAIWSIGLHDVATDPIETTARDSIALYFNAPNSGQITLFDDDGTSVMNGEASNTGAYSQGDTRYIELKRTSVTDYEYAVYSDPSYTSVVKSGSSTVSSGTQKLRYLRIASEPGARVGDADFEVDDVQFWNGVSVAPSVTNITNGAQHNIRQFFNYDGGAAGIWRFDEGSGLNATDASGNGNVGTLLNGPTWVSNSSCKYNSCLSFDGSNDYVLVGDKDNLDFGTSTDFSVEVWFKTSTNGRWILAKRDHATAGGWGVRIAGNQFIANIDNSGGTGFEIGGGPVVTDDLWHHGVLVVRRNTGGRLYLDGTFIAPGSNANVDVSNAKNFVIGATSNLAAAAQFSGLLDEVRVYSRALTDSEVREHYQREVSKYYDDFGTATSGKTYRYFGIEDSNTTMQPVTPKDTILHLRFNDNSTINVTDVSGFGNGGLTVNGPIWITNSSCKYGSCMSFDGSNDYVRMKHVDSLMEVQEFTACLWHNLRSTAATTQYLVQDGDTSGANGAELGGWIITTTSNTNLRFAVITGTDIINNLEVTNAASVGVWKFFCGTFDKDRVLRAYLDGGLVKSLQASGAVDWTTNADDFLIGQDQVLTTPTNGYLDDLLVVNRTLSPDEIYQLYLGGAQRHGGDLVGWWKFNENVTTNNITLDSSGSGNTGNSVSDDGGALPLWVSNSSCKFKGCLFFSRVSSHIGSLVEVEDSPTLDFGSSTDFTISSWVRLNGTPSDDYTIVSKSRSSAGFGSLRLAINSSGIPNVLLTDASSSATIGGSSNIANGGLHHVAAVVRRSGNAEVYVNGIREGSGSVSSIGNIDSTDKLLIGAGKDSSNNIQTHFSGYIDNVKIFKRALTPDEVMHEYLQTKDEESIYGRIHRVASADDTQSVSFNLTDHNNTFETKDYDMRIISINGSVASSVQGSASPTPACYTKRNTSQFYICSYDQTEFSAAKTSGIIYSADSDDFSSMCQDAAGSEYLFNVTGVNAFKSILPLATATCNVIGNETSIISDQGLPSRPFGSYAFTGPAKLQMSLQYDRIFINGTARFSTGQHKICIEKIGRQGANSLLNIAVC